MPLGHATFHVYLGLTTDVSQFFYYSVHDFRFAGTWPKAAPNVSSFLWAPACRGAHACSISLAVLLFFKSAVVEAHLVEARDVAFNKRVRVDALLLVLFKTGGGTSALRTCFSCW